MRKIALYTITLATVFTLSGCVRDTPIQAPINITKHSGFGTGGIVDSSVKPEKVGESVCKNIAIFAQGDCSIEKAIENGKITKVHSVSHQTFDVFGIYGTYKTIVYGE
jgi:hypothetical protein